MVFHSWETDVGSQAERERIRPCSAELSLIYWVFSSEPDELTFQMTTTNAHALQKTRTFTRFSQAEDEVINARVFVGIHYRTSDRAARAQGLQVADWVFKNFFRPMGDPRFGE